MVISYLKIDSANSEYSATLSCFKDIVTAINELSISEG